MPRDNLVSRKSTFPPHQLLLLLLSAIRRFLTMMLYCVHPLKGYHVLFWDSTSAGWLASFPGSRCGSLTGWHHRCARRITNLLLDSSISPLMPWLRASPSNVFDRSTCFTQRRHLSALSVLNHSFPVRMRIVISKKKINVWEEDKKKPRKNHHNESRIFHCCRDLHGSWIAISISHEFSVSYSKRISMALVDSSARGWRIQQPPPARHWITPVLHHVLWRKVMHDTRSRWDNDEKTRRSSPVCQKHTHHTTFTGFMRDSGAHYRAHFVSGTIKERETDRAFNSVGQNDVQRDGSWPSELLGPSHSQPAAGRVDCSRPRDRARVDVDVIRSESRLDKDGHLGNGHAEAAWYAPTQIGRALMQMILLHCYHTQKKTVCLE